MSDIIKFYKGEETGIVHESYSDINTSLFRDQYIKALSEIGAYLLAGKEFTNKDLNNIFAFIGERGTGKTSCMESVGCLLDEISINKNAENKLTIDEQIKSEIVGKKYLTLPIIDPTIFNNNTNLMQVVIGVMFEAFKEAVVNSDNLPCDTDRDKYEKNKQNLLKAFQDVKECIKYISNPKLLNCEDDDISQLAGMASVSKLNSRIGKLADRYLEFFGKNILVLQIDDIDLQTKYAYQMVEEIRKYFMHKNIIILMAVKMEQLAKVIENETAKQYESLRELEGITLPEVSDMAMRYLLKLIPINHRFYMPTAEVYVESGLQYFTNREDELKYEGKTGDENKALLGDWTSVKYAITSLIYKKCRFLFYHSKGVVSPIVPRNLRELRHLFTLLVDMPDHQLIQNGEVRQKDNKQEIISNNKSLFLNYLNNSWVDNNINTNDVEIINNIRSVKDASAINKVVIQLLKTRFSDFLVIDAKTESTNDNEVKRFLARILDAKNISYNISVADVFAIVDYLKCRVNIIYDKMLLFYIETFYSIKLYEYYDEYTDNVEDIDKDKVKIEINQDDEEAYEIDSDIDEAADKSIRKREIVDAYSNYEVLIGGSFINTNFYYLTPKSKLSASNGRFPISLKVLQAKAKEVLLKKDDVENLDAQGLQIIEFIALCLSRVLESNAITVNDNYRQYNELYYKFPGKRDYALFDIGAFFFNIVNIKRAYDRINPELYIVATKANCNSLYNAITAICKEDRPDYDPKSAILSCVSIRNFEILSDFILKTQYSRFLRSEGSIRKNLRALFSRVSKYDIKTYDRKKQGEGKPKHISFRYATSVVEALKIQNGSDNETDGYEDWFKTIFMIKDGPIFDIEKALEFFPTDRKTSYNQLRIKVNDSRIFASYTEVDRKWNELNYFKEDNFRKKLDINKARIILKQFLKDNNLE